MKVRKLQVSYVRPQPPIWDSKKIKWQGVVSHLYKYKSWCEMNNRGMCRGGADSCILLAPVKMSLLYNTCSRVDSLDQKPKYLTGVDSEQKC